MTTKYLTPKEIAEQMRCSPLTVRRLVQSGELVGVQFGAGIRVTEDDLTAYLKSNGKIDEFLKGVK